MSDKNKTTKESRSKKPSSAEATAGKAEEYLNNWKKERADFLNYKKDEARRMEEFARFANEDLLIEIIEVVDDLIIARKNIPLGNTEWLKGFDNTMKKFDSLLKKYGLERIDVKDSKFDPTLHEAVEMEEGGEVMEEVKPGYMIHKKVMRPAKVKIVK